jgi:hypothetical protein
MDHARTFKRPEMSPGRPEMSLDGSGGGRHSPRLHPVSVHPGRKERQDGMGVEERIVRRRWLVAKGGRMGWEWRVQAQSL